MGQLGQLLSILHRWSDKIVSELLRGCHHENSNVRKAVFDQTGKSLKRISERQADVADGLLLGCSEESEAIREAVLLAGTHLRI